MSNIPDWLQDILNQLNQEDGAELLSQWTEREKRILTLEDITQKIFEHHAYFTLNVNEVNVGDYHLVKNDSNKYDIYLPSGEIVLGSYSFIGAIDEVMRREGAE